MVFSLIPAVGVLWPSRHLYPVLLLCLMLSVYIVLGLPFACAPCNFPSNISFWMVLCLLTWPKYSNFLDLILFSREGFVFKMSHTCSFVLNYFQLILPILLKHHISKALILFSRVLVSVQATAPYINIQNRAENKDCQ